MILDFILIAIGYVGMVAGYRSVGEQADRTAWAGVLLLFGGLLLFFLGTLLAFAPRFFSS